jgi:lipoprotein-anchoring transpeptidase ErfK/SrfK
MEEDHYSKEFDDAPMPHSIFFTKQGHAIHGTDSVSRLGSPASHGCVRLSRANAQTLWDIVKAEGVLNTTVTLTGSSQVALARNPRARTSVAAARPVSPPQYDAYGRPLQIAPRQPTDPQYGEDIYAGTRARTPSPDQDYIDQTYRRERNDYAANDPRWPAQQQQRRIYVDPRTGQQYYVQERSRDQFYAQDYGDQGARYYGPRGY